VAHAHSTLDSLHLATAHFLNRQGEPAEFASYNGRLISAAQALAIPIAVL
jgi:hypothetical protein